ncbi:MAG: sulfatase [Gemmatimonadetes bacterium]|nr:sulfatase [Gemmatimonadota bacterium]
MKRREFMRAAGAIGGAVVAGTLADGQAMPLGAQPPPTRPNIIFIMSDDHAAHAIGAYGSRVNRTPQIDRLAQQGMLFRNVFATNAICTPSRASILTGQYSHINGVPVFNRFDSSRQTCVKLLQAGGYHTGIVGKWHLGSDPQGFDHWEIVPGQGAYRDPLFYTATGEKRYVGRYATDLITDMAIDFIRARPAERPFFLMMHHKAPHRAWEPDQEHREQFADRWIPEPVTLWDTYATRASAIHENEQRVFADLTRNDLKLTPPPGLAGAALTSWLGKKPDEVTITRDGMPVTLTGEALARWKYQRYMQDYLATIQSVDDNVGRLLDFLDGAGLAENTMVVYTSDQGFFLGDHGMFDKRFMYEESIRMPFLVRWPAAVAAASQCDAIGLNVDFAETFLDVAGLPIPKDMQGRSLLPLLQGKRPADWRRSMYYRYYHDPGDHNTRAHYGVRTETHKLIHYWKQDEWELFDLVNDPYELHNLYGEPGHAAITASLKAELQRLKRELRDEDQFANEQPPQGVGGSISQLRGK